MKHLYIFLLFFSVASFGQNDKVLGAPQMDWVKLCDTLTGETIYYESSQLTDPCCYEFSGGEWVKRTNCDNVSLCNDVVFQTIQGCDTDTRTPVYWFQGFDERGNVVYPNDSIEYFKNPDIHSNECYTTEYESFEVFTGPGSSIGGGSTFAAWRSPIYYPPSSSNITNQEYEANIDLINQAVEDGCYIVITSQTIGFPSVAVVGGAGANNSFLASIGTSAAPSNTSLVSDHTVALDCPEIEQAILDRHLNGNGAPLSTLDTNIVWTFEIICVQDSSLLEPQPTAVCVGECPIIEEPEIYEKCVKSKTLYTVIDNTGTRYDNENTIKLYFTDGTTSTFVQPAQSNPQGWTKELQVWDDSITNILENKCGAFSSETRFNPPPFTTDDLSNYTPPDGLLVPPSEVQGLIPSMAYRYLQISACSTCPAINSVELVAVNGTDLDDPILMTSTFVEGLERRYDLCKECGEEGTLYYQGTNEIVPNSDYPVCFFNCSEVLPAVPESGCLFTLQEFCDNGVTDVNGDFKPILVRYADCGDGAIITDVYELDTDGTPIAYDLVGSVVDCDSGEDAEEPQPEIEDAPFSTICKTACFNGVQIDVIIAHDIEGNELWYKDEDMNIISKPDFNSTCPPKECTTETISICADGDYGAISDGDAFSAIQLVCNDGSKELLSMASVNDLTQNVPIPTGFLYNSCAGADLVFNGCVVDEDGVQWDSYTYNGGIDFAYKNNATGEFGTPNGNLEPCPETFELINALPDKHCVSVAGEIKTVWLFAQEDKRFCAVEVISGEVHAPEDFIIVSCCGEEATVNSTYLSGFTVARPANTPNTGWNNQLVNGAAALSGDYELCFTPTDNGGNSPNMIGVNTDPNTNTSYTSIDHAVYLYVANGTYLFRLYENGTFNGSVTTNWSGQEVCFKRTGSTLEISLGGTVQFTRPTTTADQFLDDSHYYTTTGTWSAGSVTYSDFNLVEGTPDEIIKSVSECPILSYNYIKNCYENTALDTFELLYEVFNTTNNPPIKDGFLDADFAPIEESDYNLTPVKSCNCK